MLERSLEDACRSDIPHINHLMLLWSWNHRYMRVSVLAFVCGAIFWGTLRRFFISFRWALRAAGLLQQLRAGVRCIQCLHREEGRLRGLSFDVVEALRHEPLLVCFQELALIPNRFPPVNSPSIGLNGMDAEQGPSGDRAEHGIPILDTPVGTQARRKLGSFVLARKHALTGVDESGLKQVCQRDTSARVSCPFGLRLFCTCRYRLYLSASCTRP
mmetsp:Transcript_13123/g.47867  ORF Transcript_13123/g.47867 Transcript_13123/m.47867 type:complete len:215 (+) Transcript_13123:1890-2534(+)